MSKKEKKNRHMCWFEMRKKLVFTPNNIRFNHLGLFTQTYAHMHTAHTKNTHNKQYRSGMVQVWAQERVCRACIDCATLIKRFIFYEQTFNMHVSSFTTRLSQRLTCIALFTIVSLPQQNRRRTHTHARTWQNHLSYHRFRIGSYSRISFIL